VLENVITPFLIFNAYLLWAKRNGRDWQRDLDRDRLFAIEIVRNLYE